MLLFQCAPSFSFFYSMDEAALVAPIWCCICSFSVSVTALSSSDRFWLRPPADIITPPPARLGRKIGSRAEAGSSVIGAGRALSSSSPPIELCPGSAVPLASSGMQALASAPHLDSTPTARPCFELKPGTAFGATRIWRKIGGVETAEQLFFLSTFLNQAWCSGKWQGNGIGVGGFFSFFLFLLFLARGFGVGVFGERAIDSEPSYFDGTRRDIIVFVLGVSDGQTGRTVKI